MRTLSICGIPVRFFTLVIPSFPDPAVQTAARFLQDSIRRSCGIELPVRNEPAEHGIYLNSSGPCDQIRWDGFRIRTDGGNLYLDGNLPRGTLYASFDFAERFLGYRHFAHETEVIRTDGEADVPPFFDRIDNPSFQERRSNWYWFEKDPALHAHCRINTDPKFGWEKTPAEWGGSLAAPSSCHELWRFCPGSLYFETHPEYFSLVDGERIPCNDNYGPGQLCLSNPDVIRIVTENVLKELRNHPDLPLVELSQSDNGNYCRCPSCAAIDREEESHSGTLIRFLNAVGESVEREFPSVLLRTFAYGYSTKPPRHTKARRNILIRFCTFDACFRHGISDPSCPTNRERTFPEITAWGEACSQMSIWDYAANWNCYIAPFPNLISLRENARLYQSCHATSVFVEDCSGRYQGGMHPDLKAYLIGKLLWNASMSEEEYRTHIDEFLEAFYGPGWKSIRRVIEIEHETTAERCFSCSENLDYCFVPFETDPPVPGLVEFRRRNYRVFPFQPFLPDHALTEFVRHMDELTRLFGEAMEQAETDQQRDHIQRSRFSLSYAELFGTGHVKREMTKEQRKEHILAVEQFCRDKDAYGMAYNIQTEINGH
ncbi:MAG: DUF4838 domain-containing protein [Clostridia bacterium]|nr:DUF4838 domain-containing protein [Clostridia bacterium]